MITDKNMVGYQSIIIENLLTLLSDIEKEKKLSSEQQDKFYTISMSYTMNQREYENS